MKFAPAGWVILAILLASCETHPPDDGGTPVPTATVVASYPFGRMPRWSPDGRYLLFGDDRPGHVRLLRWDLTTDALPLTAADRPHNWDYRWSFDGRQIAYSAPGEPDDTSSGVFVVNISDGVPHRMSDRGREVTWCDSSRSLLFTVDHPISGAPGVYRVNPIQGGVYSLLTAGGAHPVGNPSQHSFAYTTSQVLGGLFLTEFTGNTIHTQQIGGTAAQDWAWSRDGRKLFAVINRSYNYVTIGILYRYDSLTPEGSDSVAAYASLPSADLDGSIAAYYQLPGIVSAGVAVLLPSGGSMVIAVDGYYPDMSPDGTLVTYNVQNGGIKVARLSGVSQ